METLNLLKSGEKAVVRGLIGDAHFISRASAMGFTSDTPLTMLQNSGRGPVLVYLNDTQIAIGRSEIANIQIRKEAV